MLPRPSLPLSRLYEASGDAGYLKDAEAFYDRSRSSERFTNPNPDRFSYENVIPALHLLLYKVRVCRDIREGQERTRRSRGTRETHPRSVCGRELSRGLLASPCLRCSHPTTAGT